jgi:hypothetical protein
MSKSANLYFSAEGYAIKIDGIFVSLLAAKDIDSAPERRHRKAWLYLGRGLKELIDDNFEFVDTFSDSKVIDQLKGALVEDEECKMMREVIINRGLPKFVWVSHNKLTPESMASSFRKARTELIDGDGAKTQRP